MVFGLGQRKGSGKKASPLPEDKAREEVRFWQYQLDRCVDEKNKWIERFTSAARHNEILRAEVFSLQQHTSTQRQHSAWRQHLSSRAEAGRGRSEQAERRNEPTRHQAEHVLRTPTPSAQSRQEAAPEDDFIPTPASKRFQAPCTGPRTSVCYSSAGTTSSCTLRDEVDSLRRQLQEALAQNSCLRGEVERQQQQNEFLSASAEACKTESKLLREELLTQHGINDETADETVKVLSELGRLQQDNALLTRDLQLKDSMIQLLQQELSELNSQAVPLTPRARSPGRSGTSSTGGSEAMTLQSLWEAEHQQQLLWEAVQQLPGTQPCAEGEHRGFEQAAAEYLFSAQSGGVGLDDREGSQLAAAAGVWGSERLDSQLLSTSPMLSLHCQPGAQGSRSAEQPDSCPEAGLFAAEAGQGCCALEHAEPLLSPTASSSHSVDTLSVPDVDNGKASTRPLVRHEQLPQQGGRGGKHSRVSASAFITVQMPTDGVVGPANGLQQACAVCDTESDGDDVGRRVGIWTLDTYGHRCTALHR